MGFVLSVLGTVAVLLIIFVILNRHYGPTVRRGPNPDGQAVRWDGPDENPDMIREDVEQMRSAHEALRRRHGMPGLSDRDLNEAVTEDELNRSRGRGPFSER